MSNINKICLLKCKSVFLYQNKEKMRFADLRNDIAFRKIFGNEKKTISLISFINAALKLEGNKRVVSARITDANQFPRIAGEKASVIDVAATDQRGRQFIIEMQVADKDGFDKRVQYYTSRDYSMQIEQGDDYPLLNPTYFIGILDFKFGTGTNYRSKHITIDEETGEHLLIDIQFCFIQLPKFKKKVDELDTILDKWTYFIKNAKKLDVIPDNTDDEGLKEAYIDAEKHKWTKNELIAYDNAFMRLQDAIGELSHAKKEGVQEGLEKGLQEGLEKGLQEGLEKGLEKGLKQGEDNKEAEAIIGFYEIGVAPENIAKALKVTLEKVLEIIAKHQM